MGQSYKAIKSVDPAAMVVVGGLESGNTQYTLNLTRFSGTGHITADAIGVHPYGRRPTEDWPSPSWGFGPLIPFLQSYQQALAPSNSVLPLLITEFGVSDNTPSDDNVFPEHFYGVLNSTVPVSQWSGVAFWFCWSNAMVPPFGLLNRDGTPKPMYYSFQSACA